MEPKRKIFVFGSNLAGRHGKGAAWSAKLHFGAIQGQGEGLQGNSYGIPTKGYDLEVLPLPIVETYVEKFIAFAKGHPEMEFLLTPIGCGLAGHTPKDIAPMFALAPSNVIFPASFEFAHPKLVQSGTVKLD